MNLFTLSCLILYLEGHAGEANTRLAKGIPVGRAPTVDLRNSHLSYVITWSVFLYLRIFFWLIYDVRFALSGLTAFMFYRVLVNKRKAPGRRLPRFG